MDYHLTHQQQQILLRLPPEAAQDVRAALSGGGMTFDVRPSSTEGGVLSNDFVVSIRDREYPALLLNLPAPVETHKTFDNKVFLKSGDVGQMLHVFTTAAEREAARAKVCRTLYGDYFSNGLSPPTTDIVKRRFELSRRKESFLPYQLRQAAEAILGCPFTAEQRPEEGKAVEEIVSVVEEAVDFEDWMVDPADPRKGRTLELNGTDWSNASDPALLLLLQHADLLVTAEDREEDSIAALEEQHHSTKRVEGAATEEKLSLSVKEHEQQEGFHLGVSLANDDARDTQMVAEDGNAEEDDRESPAGEENEADGDVAGEKEEEEEQQQQPEEEEEAGQEEEEEEEEEEEWMKVT